MSLPLKNVQNVQSRGFSPKESNSKCFFTLTIKKTSTLYKLPVMKNSISSDRTGGRGGWGSALTHFCFVDISTCPGSADFSYHVEIKLIHSLGQSVGIYAFMIIHCFIHSFTPSFMHHSVLNYEQCIFQIYLLLLGMSFDLLHLFLLFFFIIIYCLCLIKIHLQLNEQNNNQN